MQKARLVAGFAALALFVGALTVCSTQGTPLLCPGFVYSDEVDPAWYVPPSLDEQILDSAVIARASLLSVAPATEMLGMALWPDFRAVHKLRFAIHEYLKGSGPNEMLLVVQDDERHCWRPDAHDFAEWNAEIRNTSWDGRQAIIFLENLHGPKSNGPMTFTYSSLHVSRLRYTLDRLNRSWLPDADTYSSAEKVATDDMAFMTGGSEPWPPLITLGELKAAIAEWDATMKAGEDIEGYDLCIHYKLSAERIARSDKLAGRTPVPVQYQRTLGSGSATGVEAHRKSTVGDEGYYHYWLSGSSATYFRMGIDDLDSSPQNGWHYVLATARPLPSGVFTVRINDQHPEEIPCNFRPANAYEVVTVTITAPAGVLHEAFFDPIYATSTGEYKADASHGVLDPPSYRAEGASASTTIHAISWKARQVTVTASPGALPANHYLDFIALDGSVALRLDVDDAASGSSGGNRVLTWRVCEQPWRTGDKLMLRISASDGEPPGATRDGVCE